MAAVVMIMLFSDSRLSSPASCDTPAQSLTPFWVVFSSCPLFSSPSFPCTLAASHTHSDLVSFDSPFPFPSHAPRRLHAHASSLSPCRLPSVPCSDLVRCQIHCRCSSCLLSPSRLVREVCGRYSRLLRTSCPFLRCRSHLRPRLRVSVEMALLKHRVGVVLLREWSRFGGLFESLKREMQHRVLLLFGPGGAVGWPSRLLKGV